MEYVKPGIDDGCDQFCVHVLFRSEIANFPVYVLIGRIIYQFFFEATNFAMDSIHANRNLIRKVYVPKYFFPLSRVVSSLITSLASIVPLVLIMAFTGMEFHWMNLLFFIPLLYLLLIAAVIGLLLSAINVFFKDISHFYSIIIMVLMYTTPVYYPVSIIPNQYMSLILINPLYPILEMFRDVVMYGNAPNSTDQLLSIAYVIVYGIIGISIFNKTQDRFIYHI